MPARFQRGGDKNTQACGWPRDRFGVPWQVVPAILPELIADPDPGKARKAMAAPMRMKKLDIEAPRRAADRRIAHTHSHGRRSRLAANGVAASQYGGFADDQLGACCGTGAYHWRGRRRAA